PSIDPSKFLTVETSMNEYLYPTGKLIGGIAWQPNLVDVRVSLTTGILPVKNLDLEIRLNEGMEEQMGIADVKELNGIACTFLPQMFPGVPALSRDRLFGNVTTDQQGNPVTKPANVTEIISPMYRVQCPYLQKNSNLNLIIAAAEIKGKAAKSVPGQQTR